MNTNLTIYKTTMKYHLTSVRIAIIKKTRDKRDMCMHMADSLCCATEVNAVFQSNYTPINIYSKKKKTRDNKG